MTRFNLVSQAVAEAEWRLLKEEKERLCGYPDDQQEAAGRYSQHVSDQNDDHQAAGAVGVFLPWVAGVFCDCRNC